MTIRERQEAEELTRLSPLAAKAALSKGREKEISADDMRTCFQRDRDRILHCKSFRRLKYKTQVFLSPAGDHYRTRLTHTLEVSQVARTIARCLLLNEDLTEAIAMGHDLGHTPFGHIGESTLNRLMPGGFQHNLQSLRVARKLENNGNGLNLCAETLDGIRNHSGQDNPYTLEGQIVRLSDRIAYINHDIDDAIRGGIIRQDDLPKHCLKILGDTHGKRIDTMITSTVKFSDGKNTISMEDEVLDACDDLRNFLFERVYHDEWRKKEEARCDFIVKALYEYYCSHPEQMPNEYIEIVFTEGSERAACDYVACMTDRYAIDRFNEIFVPNAFLIK